jgi:hypothetical protein
MKAMNPWMHVGIYVLVVAVASARAGLINVPADQPTIHAGIVAAIDGDEVVVAPGTYAETITLLGKAITVRSSGGAAVTTIDATSAMPNTYGKPVVNFDSGEGADTILDGFTLTGGTGNTALINGFRVGGGIYCGPGVSPTVRQCIIQSNTADLSGGGVYCNAASPRFTDCQFLSNTVTLGEGGGLISFGSSEVTLIRCRFEGNASLSGGAVGSVNSGMTARDCDFAANTVEGSEARGAAIFATSSSSTGLLFDVARCRFIGNAAISSPGNSSIGGAIYIGNHLPGSIVNCQFTGNTADEAGAVQVSPSPNVVFTILNCTIVGNTAAVNGGGLSLRDAEEVSITNCIVWGNTDPGGMISSAQIATLSGDPTVSWSIVQGGWGGPGSNNLDADPLFADLDGPDDTLGTEDDDAHPTAGSPAIDAADYDAYAASWGGALDLDGAPRTHDDPGTADTGVGAVTHLDMGAYEADFTLPGDLDGDGDVDLADYQLFQAAFTGPQ